MEEFIKNVIGAVYKTFGFSGTILVIIILTTGYVIVKFGGLLVNKYVDNETISKYFKGKRRNRYIKELKAHTIFDKYRCLLERLPNAKIRCPLRKRLFQKLLTIRVNTHKELLEEYIETNNLDELDHDAFKISINMLLSKSHNKLVERYREAEIPLIVLDRFEDRIHDIKSFAEDMIYGICDSTRFFESNDERLSNILEILSTLEYNGIIIFEKTLDHLNGELSGLTFEGIKCNHCDVNCEYQHIDKNLLETNRIRNLLYVEDDLTYTTSVSFILRKYDVNVFIAKSIFEANQFLDGNKTVEFVILDYYLKDGNGNILEDEIIKKKLPYFYYTSGGYDLKGIKKNAKVLLKSKVSPAQLLESINSHLDEIKK